MKYIHSNQTHYYRVKFCQTKPFIFCHGNMRRQNILFTYVFFHYSQFSFPGEFKNKLMKVIELI